MAQVNVLFVDDEIKILNSIKRGVIHEEFKSYFALTGEEALEIMDKKEIGVVVTDMRMPVMDGLKLLNIVKERSPDTVRLVLSGYSQLPQILATINQAGVFKFIPKPWSMDEELIVAVKEAADYYRMRRESEELKESLEKRNIMYQNVIKNYNEKINLTKNNINTFKKFNNKVLADIRQLVDDKNRKDSEISSKAVKDYISALQSFYERFFDIVAEPVLDFNLKNLFEDISESTLIAGKELIKLDYSAVKDVALIGNSKMVKLIIIYIIEQLHFSYSDDHLMLIEIDDESGLKNVYGIKSKLTLNFTTRLIVNPLKGDMITIKLNKAEKNIGLEILGKFLKSINGSMVFHEDTGTIKIEVVL